MAICLNPIAANVARAVGVGVGVQLGDVGGGAGAGVDLLVHLLGADVMIGMLVLLAVTGREKQGTQKGEKKNAYPFHVPFLLLLGFYVFLIEDIKARKNEFCRFCVVYAVYFIQHPAKRKIQRIRYRFIGRSV